MFRRAFIAAIGSVGVAGCTSRRANETNPSETAVSPTKQTFSDAFAFHTEVLRQPTTAEYGRVELVLENSSSHEYNLRVGSAPPFTTFMSDNERQRSRLMLLPDDEDSDAYSPEQSALVSAESPSKCWSLEREVRVVEDNEVRTVAPGETVTGRYGVFTPQRQAACPGGEYRFTNTVTVDGTEQNLEVVLTLSDSVELSVATSIV